MRVDDQGPCLPVHVPIGLEESLGGYLFKVAEEYSYPSPWTMLDGLGVSRTFRSMPAPISRVAAFLKVPEADLRFRAYWPTGAGQRTFFGASVNEKHLCIGECRQCPQCLVERRPHSALHDLTFNTVCDHHRLRLMGRCPECGALLSWNRRQLDFCVCGFDLRQGERASAGAESLYLASILRRAARFPDVGNAPVQVPRHWREDIFDGLDLPTILGVIAFVLRADKDFQHLVCKRTPRVAELAGSIDNLLGTFFERWPDGALKVFDIVRAERLAKAKEGADIHSRRYSVGRSDFVACFKEGPPPFLIEVRRLHLAMSTYSTTRQAHLDDTKLISVAEAARRMRVGMERIRRLCREGALRSEKISGFTGRRPVSAIDASSLVEFEKKSQGHLCRRSLVEEFGLTRNSFDYLAKVGLIQVVPLEIGPRSDGIYGERHSAEKLFRQLKERATVISHDEVITAKNETYQSLRSHGLRPQAIEFCAKGQLALFLVEGCPHDRLDSYFVRRREVLAALKWEAVDRVGLAITDAAYLLGYRLPYLRYMLAHGIFVPSGTFTEVPPNRRRDASPVRFSKDDINRFVGTFVKGREIGAFNGIDIGRVSEKLIYHGLGVIPRGVISVNQCAIFRRAEVAPLLERWRLRMPPADTSLYHGHEAPKNLRRCR